MAGEFARRVRELAHDVGPGRVVGKVEVDQIYAHYQHEGLEFRHPRGGEAKYLEQPLLTQSEDFMRRLAKGTITETGTDLDGAMTDVVDQLSRDVHERAPREFEDLRNSAHPTVVDDERIVYDRPPLVHRLSEEELREKSRLRDLGHTEYPFGHPRHRQ